MMGLRRFELGWALRALAVLLFASTAAACASTATPPASRTPASIVQPEGARNSSVAPATNVQLARLEDGTVRLFFERSSSEREGDDRAALYDVCDDVRCVSTERNFVDFAQAPRVAAVFTRTPDGALSPASELVDESTAITETSAARDTSDTSRPNLALAATAPLPTAIYAPIFGPLVTLGASASTNTTDGPWSLWAHRSGFHHAGGGISGADDSDAFDVNLNVRGAGANMDAQMPFVASDYGTVRGYDATPSSSGSAGTDSCKSLLVEHRTAAGRIWATGYLHAGQVFVRAGDFVSPTTSLGRIGRACTDNDHLHFVAYSRDEVRNRAGSVTGFRYASFAPSILANTARISFFQSPVTLPLGSNLQLVATGQQISSATGAALPPVALHAVPDAQSWWSSSAPSVVSVSGRGVVVGRSRGTANITLRWSGASATLRVTVP